MARRSTVHSLTVATLVLATVCSACYWLRYHDLLATHLDLMEGLAVDAGAAVAADPAMLAPSDIERLRYPLERARQFIAVSKRRSPERRSLVQFEAFVAVYAEFVDELDRARVVPRDAAAEAVSHDVSRLVELASAVRAAAAAERT